MDSSCWMQYLLNAIVANRFIVSDDTRGTVYNPCDSDWIYIPTR